MDGNGRWAQQQDHPRVYGHKNAISAVRETVETCVEVGIQHLTLYAFSTENWSRPAAEVDFLMKLFAEFLKAELPTLIKHQIQFRLIGTQERLPDFVQDPLAVVFQETKNNQGMILNLAIDYGARKEIAEACKVVAELVQDDKIKIEEINEDLISQHLFTDTPDADLIIRTSGELRLSNFLLWQAAYAEFYFTELMWPDFGREELFRALTAFSKRVRRMGAIG